MLEASVVAARALPGDQAEGLRRLMATRPAALARARVAAVGLQAVSVAVLAADDALGQALTRQLAWALARSASPGVRLFHSPAGAAGDLPGAAQLPDHLPDHLLLALDGRPGQLSSSLTWAYALVKRWHFASAANAASAATTDEMPAQAVPNPAHRARLLLCGVSNPAQAQRVLAQLSATACRYLGQGLAVAGCLRCDPAGQAQDLAQLAGDVLHWPPAPALQRL